MKSATFSALAPLPLLCALAFGVAGCAGPQSTVAPAVLAQPTSPTAADLSSPGSAVSSYLDWISFAYRVGNSDVASPTMGLEEEVRVNSYVQLNKEKQRRISQVLVSFEPREPSVEGTRATVGADEVWDYRYISADGRTAISETHTASYETTYHVVLIKKGTWVVDSVDAKALSEIE